MAITVTEPVRTIIGEMNAEQFFRMFSEWKHKNPRFNEIDEKREALRDAAPDFDPSAEAWVRAYATNSEKRTTIEAEWQKVNDELETEFCKIILQS